MSPSDRRKELWSKKTRKGFKRLRKQAKKFSSNIDGAYPVYTIVVAGLGDHKHPYLQALTLRKRSGKVYITHRLSAVAFANLATELIDTLE